MKRMLSLLVIVFVTFRFSPVLVFAGDEELSALEVMAKSKEIFRSAEEEREILEVSLSYADGRKNPSNKKIERRTVFSPNGKDKTEVEYLAPVKERGTLLRIHRNTDRADYIWFKNPSWKEKRRVVGSQITAPFVWDVKREDVLQWMGERLSEFVYSFLESATEDCWLIKAVPKEGIETGYGWREISIGKNDFAYREVKYFDHQGNLEKIQTNHDLVFFKNGLWRPDRITIENLKEKEKRTTEIRVIERSLKVVEVEK